MDRLRIKLRAVTMIVMLAACAANPATHLAGNGQPLEIKHEGGEGTYVSSDVVGEDTVTDAAGNVTGTVQHRSDVAHTADWDHWGYYQGDDPIDEQDFYRISGDRDAAGEVAHQRASASTKQKIGMTLMVVGALAVVGLGVGGLALDSSGMVVGSLIGAVPVVSIGGYVWATGFHDMKVEHQLGAERAEPAADLVERCSDGHCRTDRGGRSHHTLDRSELEQLRNPFKKPALGMR